MSNFYNIVLDVLKQDKRFFTKEGDILRNAVCEAGMKFDRNLIKILHSNPVTKERFFIDVDGITVFDKIGFGWVVNNRQFLPDSYTRFKNKIGLINKKGEYISESNDVELVWAYKDCVLEGGQINEEQKRNEILYNETLAPDEVDRLLYPKVLTNVKRYNKDGEEKITEFNDDNLVIKGNNLLALSSIIKRYEGRVACICIDPPYNKGGDEFGYNDSFNHSTWLTFMKTRLQYSKRLLSPNGTIFVFCDDSEQAYLKILLDEIFGRKRFIATVIWRNSDNSNNDAKQFSQDHNYIIVYSNNEKWESLKLDRTDEQARHYKNPDNNPRGPWFDGNPVNSPNPRKNLMYNIVAPNGNIINPPPNGWRWEEVELERRLKTKEIRFNNDCTGIIRRTYLYEQKGLPPSTLWDITEESMWLEIDKTGHTRQAKYEQKKLFPNFQTSDLFKTPKPEKIIEKILKISTKENDVVLDYFGGSGTTAAVAHKMGRKYILCEQMEYIHTFTIDRLIKVIKGEQGGISTSANWLGGGSFVYCELKELNQKYVDMIQVSKTEEELRCVWEQICSTGFISSLVSIKEVDRNVEDFKELSLENKKKLFMAVLDKNMLYVNLCDIDDKEFAVSEQDKTFTKNFYGRG